MSHLYGFFKTHKCTNEEMRELKLYLLFLRQKKLLAWLFGI